MELPCLSHPGGYLPVPCSMGTVHLFISLAWSLTFLALTLVLTSCDVNVPVTNHWNGGFQGNACVPITKELTHWTMHLRFDHPVNSLEVSFSDLSHP